MGGEKFSALGTPAQQKKAKNRKQDGSQSMHEKHPICLQRSGAWGIGSYCHLLFVQRLRFVLVVMMTIMGMGKDNRSRDGRDYDYSGSFYRSCMLDRGSRKRWTFQRHPLCATCEHVAHLASDFDIHPMDIICIHTITSLPDCPGAHWPNDCKGEGRYIFIVDAIDATATHAQPRCH